MNQIENTEALATETELVSGEAVSEEAVSEEAVSEEIVSEKVVSEETVSEDAFSDATAAYEALLAEAEGVRAVYPHFDLTAELSHPVLGAILRGEVKPTLRQLYEATHLEEILESRVTAGVQAQVNDAVTRAVADAVAEAVSKTEERLLASIHARGQRPSEVGMAGGGGIRMHPAVNRLTRKERAMLARRAENGETIQF